MITSDGAPSSRGWISPGCSIIMHRLPEPELGSIRPVPQATNSEPNIDGEGYTFNVPDKRDRYERNTPSHTDQDLPDDAELPRLQASNKEPGGPTSTSEQLVTYAAFSLRKVSTTRAGIEVTEEKLSQQNILSRIRTLNKVWPMLVNRDDLTSLQKSQIHQLQEELKAKEQDQDYEWTLAQLEKKEKVLRHGSEETVTIINAYFRRAPVKRLDNYMSRRKPGTEEIKRFITRLEGFPRSDPYTSVAMQRSVSAELYSDRKQSSSGSMTNLAELTSEEQDARTTSEDIPSTTETKEPLPPPKSHLPEGECRYLLPHSEVIGQRCACVGFVLNQMIPGNLCDCGHNAAFHSAEINTATQTSSYWSIAETTNFPTILEHYGSDWHGIAKFLTPKTHIMV